MRAIVLLAVVMAVVAAAGYAFASGPEVNLDDVTRMLRQAEGYSQNMDIPDNPHRAAAEEAAREVNRRFRSEQFQQKLKAEIERIRKEVFTNGDSSPRESGYYADALPAGRLGSDERLWILVSSSVPLETLRAYAAAIDRTGDENIVMVMRGFIDGMKYIRPTMQWMQQVLFRDPGCRPVSGAACDLYRVSIQIDPLIFSRYGIGEAPAFVYAQGVEVQASGTAAGLKEQAYWVLRGDVSLMYALEVFHRETRAGALEGVIKTLRGEYGRSR